VDFGRPLFGNWQSGQVKSLFERVVGRENAAAVVDFTVLTVQTFDSVSRVNRLSDLG